MKLDATALATILAALRYYQQNGQGEPDNRSDEIHDIATGGDDSVISLDSDGIDELCERLNTAGQRPENADAIIDRATERYVFGSGDNIEIDDDPEFSIADGGVWVQAWLWVETESDEDEDDDA